MPRPVLFIGGGNMASAIIRAGLRSRVLASHATVVAEPMVERRRELAALGVVATPSAEEGVRTLRHVELGTNLTDGRVVLAVKPQVFEEMALIAPELAKDGSRAVVSIMAGVTRDRLARVLPGPHRFVRVMPNLPISAGKGMTAIADDAALPPDDVRWVERLFGAAGLTTRLPESLMDAFTAVAGSGPAYLFYLAEAMERAALAIGFDAATARTAVRQTLVGAAALMDQAESDPAALRAAVTSKGGTTHAACTVLDRAGVMEAFTMALTAARDRGRELSG